MHPLVLLLVSLIPISAPTSIVYSQNKTIHHPGPGSPNGIRINLAAEKQTIHSFGASDCWTAKYIGDWADAGKKNQVADLLFSTDTTAGGNPKGIGLSLWRFNIGAGSYEQGVESDIRDDWRREECFLNEDGTYNWKKQSGQQWFLKAAKERGVRYTLGFSLTPPAFMSINGKAYNASNLPNLNIKPGKLAAYADFIVKVSSHFKFDYVSPINEPQWYWGRDRISQEGTQATNAEIASLVKLISPGLYRKRPKCELVIGEAGQWDYLYSKDEDGRGDQINAFFSAASPSYIGDLPNVKQTISGHSYFTTCPDDYMTDVRKKVADKINQVNPALSVWQTEFGILGNNCDTYTGAPRNTGIDYGLYVANVIHHDLTVANVTSWQWWLAMSPYDYSDALIYINATSGKINQEECKLDGTVLQSKQLWAFGNYSRFIRPGMKRIEAASGTSLKVSAYKDALKKTLIVVIINPESEEKELQLNDGNNALNFAGNSVSAYITDAESNLEKTTVNAGIIKVRSRSVTTLVGTYL